MERLAFSSLSFILFTHSPKIHFFPAPFSSSAFPEKQPPHPIKKLQHPVELFLHLRQKIHHFGKSFRRTEKNTWLIVKNIRHIF